MKKALQVFIALIMLTLLGTVASSFGLQTVTDYAVRSPNGANQQIVGSVAVPGGTIYTTATMNNGVIIGGTSGTFVPVGAAGVQRYLNLTDVKTAAGVPIAATASTGIFGISRVDSTSMYLIGEAASGVAATDTGLWEFVLPDTYVAGANVPVTVNTSIAGTGTFTAASTMVKVDAYTEINGVETPLTVSAAQQFTAANTSLVFTVTGTGLTPGAHVVIEVTMTLTDVTGPLTGHVNSVSIQG